MAANGGDKLKGWRAAFGAARRTAARAPRGAAADLPGRYRLEAPGDQLCAATDTGRVRDQNEDAFWLSDDGMVLILADGMGGHEAGELASRLAVEAAAGLMSRGRLETAITDEAVERLLWRAMTAAHDAVLHYSSVSPELAGMGAALIVACVIGDELWCCHVGDVRCYRKGQSGLVQMTQDHSVVGALVRSGQLTPEEARLHPHRHEVLQAVGMSQPPTPDVNRHTLAEGDRVLLCSDGLWEAVVAGEIEAILEWEGPARQLVSQLIDRANDAGGHDNITAILYEHRRRDP